MARVSVPGFCGGANTLAFLQADVEDTQNLFTEIIAPGTAQKGPLQHLRDIPGVDPYAQVDDTPGRFCFAQDDRAWVVVGGSFSEVFPDKTTILRGSVASNSAQVSIVSNGSAGNQLLIVTGGQGYVFDLLLNTLTLLDGSGLGSGFPVGEAQCCEFLDSYGIVVQRNSRRWFISDFENFLSWDPLDVYERSRASDNIVAVRRRGTEIWFLGSATSEVWYDSGDALTPFQALPALLNYGGANAMAFIRYRDELAFLESGTTGGGIVSLTQGYQKRTISTRAVEQDIQRAGALNFSYLITLQMQGHEWLALLLPELEWTWVYDGSTNTWTKWTLWNTTTCETEVHLMQSFMYAFSGTGDAVPLITDNTSGVIYQLSFDAHAFNLV